MLYEISTPRKPANKTPPEHVVHSSSLSSYAHNCIVELFSVFFSPRRRLSSFSFFIRSPPSPPPPPPSRLPPPSSFCIFPFFFPGFSKSAHTPSITFGNIRGRPVARQTINLFSAIDWQCPDAIQCQIFIFSYIPPARAPRCCSIFNLNEPFRPVRYHLIIMIICTPLF